MLIYRRKWGLLKFQQFIRSERVIHLWLTLEADFKDQFQKGNSGEPGQWIEKN